MNGGQDLGGMMGFGPVVPEPDKPVFHAEWERRTFAMAMAMGLTGAWTIDASRHARELLPPPEYMLSSYYAIWFRALERLVVERGLLSEAELAEGRALAPPAPLRNGALAAGEVVPRFRRGWPSDRPAAAPARFAPGEAVRARNLNPTGHTRLPRYARGRRGLVERVHGAHVFPDAAAHDRGEVPEWLYTVRFEGTELWGEAAEPGLAVAINAFESYLEPA